MKTTGVRASYRQAIVTKYYGPTNTRGARIRATCEAGSLTVSWDYALGVAENYEAACNALLKKLGWDANGYRGGYTGDSYVWVECRR